MKKLVLSFFFVAACCGLSHAAPPDVSPSTNSVSVHPTSGAVVYPAGRQLIQVFADSTARAAAVPTAIGQVGWQVDTHAFYRGTGTSAGNWTIINTGGGGGSGTVTEVALTMPDIFSVAGSPITEDGIFAVTLATQLANKVLAGPTTGSAATPTFRALVAADIPDLSAVYVPIASVTGGGVLATGGFTLTVPATGTAQLIGGVLALDGFSSVTGTLANARIAAALSGHTYEGLTITATTGGALTIANNKTLTVSDNVTLASDGTGTRTLNIGAGGTLGTAAFTAATAYVPIASVTGGGVIATGGFTLTVPATGTAQLTGGVLALDGFSGITGTLPVANGGTGITSLGTGVATWLGTPSFANLSSLLTGDTIAGSASTNTFTNKTFDAGATGNVLKAKGYIYLTHPHLADGTNATIGTTATSITYGHATFSNSVDKASNYVEYFIQVPEDIDTSVALRARIKVLLGNTDTGSQRYVLSSVSVADSAVPGSASLANEINVDFAGDASGANGDVETSAWTTLTSWEGALTAGQTWRIRLARDGDTSDSSTVNSSELGLVIEYGITQ